MANIEIINLDEKDKKILYELDFNARMPLSLLAKQVGLSEEVVNYRIKNLIKEGVIKGFNAVINFIKLGYAAYRIYLRFQGLSDEKEQEIIDYLKNYPNVFWLVSISGSWDMEIIFLAKNFYQFSKILSEIYSKFGNHIRNNILSMSVDNYQFMRRYLLEKKIEPIILHYGGEPSIVNLDDTDNKILRLISTNARMKIIEIAKKINLVNNAVKYRINNLQKIDIIQGYRTFIDIQKLGFEWYKILITLSNKTDKKINQILNYCKLIPQMQYFIKCIGSWDIEIELVCKNNNGFRIIQKNIRNKFYNSILSDEVCMIDKEYKLTYFPF